MAGRWLPILVAFALSALPGTADEPIVDPDVQPAQFVRPASRSANPPAFDPSGVTAPATAGVIDPPTPVVRIQVRVASHAAVGKDVPYKITVANTSSADAYKVKARVVLPADVAGAPVADPPPDNHDPKKQAALASRELVWSLNTLRPGEKREIDLTIRPTPGGKELRTQAFVSFEHGETVVTKVDRAKLTVRKAVPMQAISTESVTVRVEVANPGTVAVPNVQLVEDVTKGFEFVNDGGGEKGTSPEQRVWQLGTLRPGERKLVEYRLSSKNAAVDALATSSVVKSPDAPDGERAESSTKLLIPGLKIDLTGPPTASAGEPALYEIVARNTGTLPLNDVRITGAIPVDCTLSKMTNGGQKYRDQIVWTVPSLKPGEAHSVRFGLKANTTGKRTIRAAADSVRGNLEKSSEVVTSFQGTAVLTWDAKMESATLGVGRSGLLTVTVKNAGGESARGARVRVELPGEVRFDQATPRAENSGNEVVFDAETIPAGGTRTYTVTFKAERSGQAWFRMKLAAEVLGDKPITKEQSVEITSR